MKRLLLLGTLLAVATFAVGCSCGGYRMCATGPMNCYSSCDPCATGCATPCHTKYISPYAGQFYAGEECGSSCGGCGDCGGCGERFRPLARWCNLFSMGGNSCGCACEKYYGDYINNPPSLCNPCDQYGGLAGFSAKCSGGSCGGCDSCATTSSASMSYSAMPYAPVSQPMVQPVMSVAPPASGCKSCNQGNTFYTSQQQVRPQPQVQPTPVRQDVMVARNQQMPGQSQPVIIAQSRPVPRASQQPMSQDKLVSAAGTQQVNYRMSPVRQVAVGPNEQFGSTNKVIQPATVPTNGRVVHAK